MRMQSCRTKSRNSCILLAKNPMAPPSLPQVPLPLPPPCLLLLFPSPSPSPTAAPPLPHPPFACTLILCIRLYKRARRGRHARRTHARTQARRNTRARGAAGGGGGGGAGAQPRGDGPRRLTRPPPRPTEPARAAEADPTPSAPGRRTRPGRPSPPNLRPGSPRAVRARGSGLAAPWGSESAPFSGPCGAAAGVRGPGSARGHGADPAPVNVEVLAVLMCRSACSLWYQ